MSIIIRNMARVKVPEDKLAQVLRRYLYEGRNGERLKNYKYTPSNGYAYLPLNPEKLRQVASELNMDMIDERSEGLAISQPFVVKDSFKFRDYQVEPAYKLLDRVVTNNNGVLRGDCGLGKSSVMTWVSGQLGKKTLILVDMSSLAASWVYTFEMVYGITPQVITKDTVEFADVCIATFQLLNLNPALVDKIRNDFGTLLVDEVHGSQAQTYKEVLFKFNSKYKIGCTATFLRKNYTNEVLADLISDISVEMVDLSSLKCDVKFMDTGSHWYSSNPDDWGKIISKLAKDKQRNDLIVSIAATLATKGRKIVIAGLTIESLQCIHDKLKELPDCRPQMYVGTTTMKQDDQIKDDVKTGKVNIILTVNKLSKGVDIVALDCLIFAKPNNNQAAVTQLAGRIVRKLEGKPTPLVVDLVDNSELAKRFANNRRKWYRQLGYTILES